MSLFSKKSKNSGCTGCGVASYLALLLYLIATVVAAIGMYMAHVDSEGFVFGTNACSLSIAVFVFTVWMLKRGFTCCCNCNEVTKK